MDIFEKIRSEMPTMRKSEQKIADLVLTSPDVVMNGSISEAASLAGVSDPTVVRFCKQLGLKGFMELKLRLASAHPVETKVLEDITETDSVESIFTHVMRSTVEAVSCTERGMDRRMLEQAVDAMVAATRWEFYGMGGSGIIALDAHHKFFRLGVPSVAYNDSHMQAMSAAQLDKQAVAVVISHSGATKDIIESADIAKNAGATLIGILGKKNSELAKHCDIPLCVFSRETALRLAPKTGRIMQLALLDALFLAVAMRIVHKEGFDRLDKVKRALLGKVV
ncbi:MurR/RpiR family transcriptional regulator [Desulfoplanes formicivorans]|uniref:Transcriptional regulator n=1 Tax=Desulfoplanes formicivorans TaxID=1592317 RepID=A0A194ALD7_9BACT|nr:MurR/RpiR family transcriptional regulator [Desulfoplanes formicivorans]GAU09484.1 transcriptional regulator [Desulfoplanes formicivorans]